jgi:hypothetical protein
LARPKDTARAIANRSWTAKLRENRVRRSGIMCLFLPPAHPQGPLACYKYASPLKRAVILKLVGILLIYTTSLRSREAWTLDKLSYKIIIIIIERYAFQEILIAINKRSTTLES